MTSVNRTHPQPPSSTSSYVGRFAPSPSGPLHFGSLITAVGSYLQAKQQGGKWLIRIDDIDPPREMPGATQQILTCLEAHGLEPDGPVIYQSKRHGRYQNALEELHQSGQSYYCSCTRKAIKEAGGIYPGTCRLLNHSGDGCSLRFVNEGDTRFIDDVLLGRVAVDARMANEDFIIRRKDKLIAYHLASVVDDRDFGITEVVRGADLLAPSACQISLFKALNGPVPRFLHLPVAASKTGVKLSKQNHAAAVDNNNAIDNLVRVLDFLGQKPVPLTFRLRVDKLLEWAIGHWSIESVPKSTEIVINPE